MLGEAMKMPVSLFLHAASDLDGPRNVHKRSFDGIDVQTAGEIFKFCPYVHGFLPLQA
jgi:hypothetical protein